MKRILVCIVCIAIIISFGVVIYKNNIKSIYDPYYEVVEKLNKEYGEELFIITNPNEDLLQTPIEEYERQLREMHEFVLKEQPSNEIWVTPESNPINDLDVNK